MKHKILIIEDDKDIRQTLSESLRESDFEVACASDGLEGLQMFEQGDYDCILLDLMLPKRNGLEVLNAIRQVSQTPVIVVSAKDTDFDIATALDLRADDYLSKPFSLVELVARVKTNVRRASLYADKSSEVTVLKHHNLCMDLEAHVVIKDGNIIKLTSTEYEMLKLFMQYQSRVFTKEDLYKAVWEETYYGDENIVNVHMSRLREKIETNTKTPQHIETLWGIGYRMRKENSNDKK